MANFALILPRPEMVAQAGRIARQLGMKVVLNQYAVTEQILDVAADARKLGADIVVARGLHASILREHPSGLFIRFHHALQSLKSGILTWFF